MGKMHKLFGISDQTPALVRISSSDSFLGFLGNRYFIVWIGFWSGHIGGWYKIGFFGGWQRFHGWERTWQIKREVEKFDRIAVPMPIAA
jgi:hypothetical protein